jgi:hypothetical protein
VHANYRDHGRALLAYAPRLTGDRTAAEDVVQETLIRAWRHPEALANRKGSARRWLEEPKWALACTVTVVGHRRVWCSAGVIWHICDMPLATAEEAEPARGRFAGEILRRSPSLVHNGHDQHSSQMKTFLVDCQLALLSVDYGA